MKDDDFLDDLYSNSAKDVPPESLDQAILKHARDNVQKGNFLMRRQWQQFLSLAAVMVLSVYVVLDVGDQSRDVEGLSLSEEASEFIEPAFDEKPVASKELNKEPSPSGSEMRAKAESFKRKEAKRMIHDEMMPLNINKSISRSIDESSSEQGLASPAYEEPNAVRGAESSMLSLKEMLEKLERLIAEDKQVEAKQVYDELIDLYPNEPLPISIIEAFK